MFGAFGDNAAHYAHQMRCRSSALAHDIGPRRGGIALGVLAAAIGLPFLIRFLKNRNIERELEFGEEIEPGVMRRARRHTPRVYSPPAY
jgi:hypothetical protein